MLSPEQEAAWQHQMELAFDVTFTSHKNLNVFCPFHEEPASSRTRSCSVSITGAFVCHSCGAKGSYRHFFAKTNNIPLALVDARLELLRTNTPQRKETVRRFNTSLAGGIPASLPDICHQQLLRNEKWLKYLTTERGLTLPILQKYKIGCDEHRITIPVYDEAGTLVNIRRYLPHASKYGVPKMVTHPQGDGSPRLYPLSILDEVEYGEEMIVCEGEWDRHLLEQHGFNAITNTGNCKTWSDDWTQLLHRYHLVFLYDVNDKWVASENMDKLGQRMARARAQEAMRAGCVSVRVLDLPLPTTYVGGDVTNWFVDERHTAKELRALLDTTPQWVPAPDPLATSASAAAKGTPIPEFITLDQATSAAYFYQPFKVRCLVAGHASSPFLVPKKVKAEVWKEEGTSEIKGMALTPWDGRILSLLNCSMRTQKSILKAMLGIDADARVTIEVEETMNVEEIYLIPTVEYDKDQGPYVLRKAYYVGKGLDCNRVYDLSGFTLPDPSNQQATHLFTEAVPAETNIDSFSLTPLQKQQLREVFATEDIHGKFEDIAGQQASHITHIHGRNDLHTAVDLAFHSPLSFDFEGVRLRKGWLEILIIGDTRTGKGFVTEGLARHYRVGEVVSGENMSLAGIIGGVQHIGDRWTLVWGKLPLADKRLVILDECGSLTHSEIGKLSRIRSEGVAEITKVISEKTTARTRIIWLANPRSTPGSTMPTVIADFNYGIEAVPALIGSAEDVARFDYALIVSREDVPLELINKTRKDNTPLRYSSELCHALIMWAWSRKPEQIVFDEDVTPLALQAAKALGNTFSARICLIQGADVRHKLARIATAAAARTFSTEDGEILRVRRKHMEFAYNFLYHIYSKACSGYLQLSEAEVERSVLRNPEAVQHALQLCGGDIADLIDGLLEHRLITLTDICDYANIELGLARSIISALVRARALIKENHGYTKKEAFKKMLRALKHKLARAKNQEQPVSDEGMEDEYAHGDRTSEHPGGNGELNAEHTGETERTDTLSGNASESV